MTLKARPISELTPKDGLVLVYWGENVAPALFDAEYIHARIASGAVQPMYWAHLPKLEVAPPPPPAPKMFCWVQYRLRQSGAICPATITRINDDGTVGIAAFPHFGFGSIITDADVPYGTEPGQWSYPEEAACPAQPEV